MNVHFLFLLKKISFVSIHAFYSLLIMKGEEDETRRRKRCNLYTNEIILEERRRLSKDYYELKAKPFCIR